MDFLTTKVLCGTVAAVVNVTAHTEIILRPSPDSEAQFFVSPNQTSPGFPVGQEFRLNVPKGQPHVTLYVVASDNDSANYLHVLTR